MQRANFLCSLPKVIGQHPDTGKDITLNSGRFGPYLKCENKSARIETSEDIFTIGLNRAVIMIAEAKPGRISSSEIKMLDIFFKKLLSLKNSNAFDSNPTAYQKD